jgi:hypothetical protein
MDSIPRKSPPPLPRPARLLGEQRGMHPPQLHPSDVARVLDKKGLLIIVWRGVGFFSALFHTQLIGLSCLARTANSLSPPSCPSLKESYSGL